MNASPIAGPLRRHPISLIGGLLTGAGIAVAWLTWVVNFAPFADDRSSVWSTPPRVAADTMSAREIYQPRVDELMNRLRVDGRFGGMAWQNLREATDTWLFAEPIACLNHLIDIGAIGLIDDSLLDAAIEAASKGNFSVALRLADEIGSASIRRRWIARAFNQFARSDPESALLALNSFPERLQYPFMMMVAQAWSSKDPRRAFERLVESGAAPQMAAFFWAESDPDGAFKFLSGAPRQIATRNGGTVSSRLMLDSVLRRMSNEDPEKAIRLLATLPGSGTRANHLRGALQRLGAKDPRRARELANQLPGDLERLNALTLIATSALANDPALAAEIRSTIPGERARSNAEASSVWAGRNYEQPEIAASKIDSITDPIARSDAMHSVATVWLDKKPVEFGKFTSEQAAAGNLTWIRSLADLLVDRSSLRWHAPPTKLVKNLSPEAITALRQEVLVQTPPESREKMLAWLNAD